MLRKRDKGKGKHKNVTQKQNNDWKKDQKTLIQYKKGEKYEWKKGRKETKFSEETKKERRTIKK